MTDCERETPGRPEVDFDHHSAEFRESNYAQFDDLRSRCPVAHSTKYGGFWVLTDYQSVFDAARDDDLFNSFPSVGVPESGLPFPIIPIESDPPLTKKLRDITLGRFSPHAVDRLEPKVRSIATDLIDRFAERGSCDIVAELTTPLPARLILHMLGMDEEKYTELVDWTHTIVHDRAHDQDKTDAAASGIFGEITTYMELRRARGLGDDLLSDIMRGTVDGEPLDDTQIVMYTFMMMLGAMDTTGGLTGNALVRMVERPRLRARLIADRSLLAAATEEFLRHDTPNLGLARTLSRDVEFHGQRLRAGDRAILMWAAANRDPAVFPNPDEIDFDRENKKHLSFGVGTHRCLGSSLARMMFRVMIDEILTRLPDFEIAGTPEWFADAGEVHAVRHLPIRFTPGARTVP